MKRAASSSDITAAQTDSIPALDLETRELSSGTTAAASPQPDTCMLNAAGGWRHSSPLRLTLAARLGDKIDGAWWPRTGVIARELPELVAVLDAPLGQITHIDVNWSSLQSQPDLNWHWYQGVNPHVMTVDGRDASAKILVIPHRTAVALAVMLMRRAAGLHIDAAHRGSRACETAECIVRAARGDKVFGVGRARQVAAAVPR